MTKYEDSARFLCCVMMIQLRAESLGPGDRLGQEKRLVRTQASVGGVWCLLSSPAQSQLKHKTDYSWKLAVTRVPTMTDLFGKFRPVPCGEEFVGRLVDNYNKTDLSAL